MLQPVSKVGDLEMSEEPQIPEAINSDLLAEPEEVEGEELENYISCAKENCRSFKQQILFIENKDKEFILNLVCESCGAVGRLKLPKGEIPITKIEMPSYLG